MTQSQGQRRTAPWIVMSLVCVTLLVAGGCEDRAGSAAVKEAQHSIAEAGHLVRAAEKPAPLTDDELIKATLLQGPPRTGKPSPAAKRLAEKVVNRLDDQDAAQRYQALLDELDQLNDQLAKTQDADSIAKMAQDIALRARELVLIQQQLQTPTVQLNHKRTERARNALKGAIAATSQSGQRAAQIGPLVVLGTLEMNLARKQQADLNQWATLVRKQQSQLGRLLNAYTRESIAASRLAGYDPQETAQLLAGQLEGDKEPLRTQLTQAKQEIDRLEQAIEKTQQRHDENLKHAQQLHRQYLQVLEQADKARGNERYELKQQAYELKVGSQGQDQSHHGVLFYDSQVERAQNELDVLQSQLAYEKLRRDSLAQAIKQVESRVAELNDQQKLSQLQTDRQTSEQYSQKLAAQITQQLDLLTQSHQAYVARYNETLAAYQQANKAYNKAAQAAPARERTTRDYAKKMVDLVTLKTADLQQTVIEYCNSGTAVMLLVAQVEPVAPAAQTVSRQYVETAEKVQASIATAP